MQAGKLRTKVTFEQETQVSDGGGGYQVGWGNPRVVFCHYMAQSGREQLEGGRLESGVKATLQARTKSVSFLDAGWTALIDGVRWNVRAVIPFGQRDRRTDIVIERGVAV